jgi:hypothetical protein
MDEVDIKTIGWEIEDAHVSESIYTILEQQLVPEWLAYKKKRKYYMDRKDDRIAPNHHGALFYKTDVSRLRRANVGIRSNSP